MSLFFIKMIWPSEFMGVLLIFLGFWILQCTTAEEHKPLICWDCNSEFDARCGDPFNNYSIGFINCDEVKVEEHIFEAVNDINRNVTPRVCRKIVQKIENRIRVIRGCGFLPDPKYDNKQKCLMRSGTKNVNVQYCSCTTPLCNVGHSETRPPVLNLVISIVVTLSLCYISF